MFPLIIVNFNHFFIQPAPDEDDLKVKCKVETSRIKMFTIFGVSIVLCFINVLCSGNKTIDSLNNWTERPQMNERI